MIARDTCSKPFYSCILWSYLGCDWGFIYTYTYCFFRVIYSGDTVSYVTLGSVKVHLIDRCSDNNGTENV